MKKMMIGLVLSALSFSGCGVEPDGQCQDREDSVQWDEEADNGVVPEDLLAFAETTATSTSAEGPEGDPEISMEIARRGSNAFYVYRCGERLEIPLTVSFATIGDDALDEEIEVRARESDGSLSFAHRFEEGDLSGSYTPAVEEGMEFTHLDLFIEIEPNGGGTGEFVSYTQRAGRDSISGDESEVVWSWEW